MSWTSYDTTMEHGKRYINYQCDACHVWIKIEDGHEPPKTCPVCGAESESSDE